MPKRCYYEICLYTRERHPRKIGTTGKRFASEAAAKLFVMGYNRALDDSANWRVNAREVRKYAEE
jgi:hypothetical protein